MKNKYIKDLKTGDYLEQELFAVKMVRLGITAGGKNYLDLNLVDKTGEVNAKIWADNLKNCPMPEVDEIIGVYGSVEEFKDKKQINITGIEKNLAYSLTDFLPTTERNQDEMWSVVAKTIKNIKNKDLKKLLDNIFNDEMIEKFKNSPGAEHIHHAYLGGLLEHVVEMLTLAKTTVELYPQINDDLLNAGIILHDLGKLEEYTVGNSINRSVIGNLVGHLILGTTFVDKEMAKIKSFPENLRAKILNMLISHHERPEFGSPVRPMTFEAVALTYIDNLSAKINTADKVYKENEKNSELEFSDKNFALDAKMYLQ
ncbi:MAG: HD domain-containing protein [Patescibacteria group bacterium]